MRYLIVLLALAGITVSSLALYVHYSPGTQSGSVSEGWGCGKVARSPYSVVAGIPIAAIGIGGYAALGLLALARRRAPLAGLSLAALVYSLYLSHIEMSVLHIWCLYCLLSLAVVSLITGTAWWWALVSPEDRKRAEIGPAC